MDASTDRPFAVVTGASSGIGYELAKQLGERGYDVLICAEDAELESARQRLAGGGGEVYAVRADLATPEGVEQLAAEVSGRGRPVDVVCLNAGVGVGGPFVETPLQDHLRLVDLNVTSVVHLAHLLVPAMAQRGSGRVLVTASIAALMPGPWYSTYAASKAFLLSFAEALRYELKDTGVTVTALMPGSTDTEFFERADLQDSTVGESSKDDPADVARDGLEALMDGKDHVVAHSWSQKVQAVLSKGAPEPAKAAMHAKLTRTSDS